MSIFPKCMIGRSPQITYHGYVLPCCWINYQPKILFGDSLKNNPFIREDFNLYNNKLKDILENPEWVKMLDNILEDTPTVCSSKCSTFIVNNNLASKTNTVKPTFYSLSETPISVERKISDNEFIFLETAEKYKPILKKTLQLETTSRCTAKCPYCSRTTELGKGLYNKGDISLDIISDILNYTDWNNVTDCGRYGDPIFYKHFYEMLDILEKSSIHKYELHTAATGRGLKWWTITIDKLLKVINSGTRIELTFGIDGLEDTSKIHRVNQNWNEITTSMRMAVDAGIDTTWQCIPFSQNEHQIDQIKALALEWGVKLQFLLSHRFTSFNDPMIPKNPNLHSYKDIQLKNN
jgi:hypothetical protein